MSQMEENAHCPSPEKLSSLAFCLSMNSLCAHRGPRQGQRAGLSRAVPRPSDSGPETGDGQRPGECGDGEKEQRGCNKQRDFLERYCLLVNQKALDHFY